MLPPPVPPPPLPPAPPPAPTEFAVTAVAGMARLDICGVLIPDAKDYQEVQGRFCTMLTRETAFKLAYELSKIGVQIGEGK